LAKDVNVKCRKCKESWTSMRFLLDLDLSVWGPYIPILCSQNGSTPLQAAMKNGHQDVVDALQSRAASQKTKQVESFFR